MAENILAKPRQQADRKMAGVCILLYCMSLSLLT